MIFYDFEVFKYDWLVVIYDLFNQERKIIVNNPDELDQFYQKHKDDIWIGYNSKNYDQYILKGIILGFDPSEINNHIIVERQKGYSYSNLLNKIPMINYDALVKLNSLKVLEGFMGHNIKESSVSFDIDRKLTEKELDEVIEYCIHDVEETIEVFLQNKSDFDSKLALVNTFKLPMSYLSKSDAQLSAIILGANRVHNRNDEFDLIIPKTLRLKKYKNILDWYLKEENRSYDKTLDIDVAGVPHKFAWGGLHGAKEKYFGKGFFVNVDVASFYPAIMIEYDLLSRNIADPKKYVNIRDTRIELKAKKDPKQLPYKLVLNSTYGAMKDKYNAMYDPRQANNVCVTGQLLLLDLIEKLEPFCDIIQSNTDGILVKLKSKDDFERLDDTCYEWEERTHMQLEFDMIKEVYQKDVNNYIVVGMDGKIKSKGAYVKKLGTLDYDLPIINEAVKEYLLNKVHPAITINNCNELIKFQKIVKIMGDYKYAMHNGIKIHHEKTFRVFASNREDDGILFKCKLNKNPEKFANTPDKALIDNEDVSEKLCPKYLDKSWYIDLAIKRLNDFGVEL